MESKKRPAKDNEKLTCINRGEMNENCSICCLDLARNDIGSMLEESISEGHRHIQRLVKEYQDGVNQFDGTGEAIYAVMLNGKITAVCGLNRDPYSKSFDVGRVRRLYVLKKYRRNGIAKKLMEAVIDQARENYKTLVLFTDNQIAEKYYSTIGFISISDYPKSTHYLEL
jgi:GNAT superfamily N-acetyltransferase